MLVKNPNNDLENGRSRPLESYSEKEKLEKWHLKAQIDYTIQTCTHSPDRIKELSKVHNLKAGKRNALDHEHLTKTYGEEFPAKLGHIPLAKCMFDALLGIKREIPFSKSINTADSHSFEKISKRRQQAMLEDIKNRLYEKFIQNVQQAAAPAAPGAGVPQPAQPAANPLSEHELKKMKAFFKRNWKDHLEISAVHMMNYLVQEVQFAEKEIDGFNDLFTAGSEFYQSKVTQIGITPSFEILDSREVFVKKPRHVKYVADCDRVRICRLVSVSDVINRHGHRLDKPDLEKLYSRMPAANHSQEIVDARLIEHSGEHQEETAHLIEENYCEWKSNIKIPILDGQELTAEQESVLITAGKEKEITYKYRLDRYEGLRYGQDIYVAMGKSKFVTRSVNKPWYVRLTVNGIINDDGNGKPYSYVNATADLQDKYDYMFMHWENIVTLSGVKALMWDYDNIPEWMGTSPAERVMKFQYYLKQGLALAKRKKNDMGEPRFEQTGEVDLSLNESIKVIIEMIRFLEETAARIIGVPRQMIGQISQYDGKATSEMAQNAGTLTTKHLFMLHQDLMRHACQDLLNNSRIAFKDGLNGSYILGSGEREMFTIDPEEFSLADWAIFVGDGQLEMQDMRDFRSLIPEFVKGQMIDVETVVNSITIRSVTELKETLLEGIQNNSQNNAAGLQEQLKQAMMEIQKLQQAGAQKEQQQMQIEGQKVGIMQQQADTQDKVADSTINLNQTKAETEKERVKLEGLQMTYNNQSMEVANK